MIAHGIRHNRQQFGLQLLMVFLVGLTIGMTRTVLPGMAESDFGTMVARPTHPFLVSWHCDAFVGMVG